MAKEIKESRNIKLKKASLFKRAVAYFIDLFIVSFVITFAFGEKLASIIENSSFDLFSTSSEIMFLSTVFSISLFFYFVLSEFLTFQTIGKNIMNLHIIPLNYYLLFNSKMNSKSNLFDFNFMNRDSKITPIKKSYRKKSGTTNKDGKKNKDKKEKDGLSEDDYKLTKKIALLSNLFNGNLSVLSSISRSLYLLPLFSFISTFDFVFIFFTRFNQRIFEVLSKTMVVEFSYEEELVI
ncbi:MAG: RDD family protein [Candidatus Woesearchaeota archaeon]